MDAEGIMDVVWFGKVPVGLNKKGVRDGWVTYHAVFRSRLALRFAKWLYT